MISDVTAWVAALTKDARLAHDPARCHPPRNKRVVPRNNFSITKKKIDNKYMIIFSFFFLFFFFFQNEQKWQEKKRKIWINIKERERERERNLKKWGGGHFEKSLVLEYFNILCFYQLTLIYSVLFLRGYSNIFSSFLQLTASKEPPGILGRSFEFDWFLSSFLFFVCLFRKNRLAIHFFTNPGVTPLHTHKQTHSHITDPYSEIKSPQPDCNIMILWCSC